MYKLKHALSFLILFLLKIFKKLKSIDYNGLYTLQTAREERGNEIETVKKHKEIIREFYNEKSV